MNIRLRGKRKIVASGPVPDESVKNMVEMKKYKTFGKNRSLRLKDFVYKGPYVYFITSTTYRRKSFFEDDKLAQRVIEQIKKIKPNAGFKLYVYCVMPDHVHLLLSPKENGKNLSEIMQEINSRTTRLFWEHGNEGKLWQRGFYDHVVRKTEDLKEIALYILNNPVRKGLVEKYEDYPFCGLMDELYM